MQAKAATGPFTGEECASRAKRRRSVVKAGYFRRIGGFHGARSLLALEADGQSLDARGMESDRTRDRITFMRFRSGARDTCTTKLQIRPRHAIRDGAYRAERLPALQMASRNVI